MSDYNIAHIIEGWGNYLGRDPLLDKLAVARAKECLRCPHAKESAILSRMVNDKRAPEAKGLLCGLCGCPISAKARRRDETCPDGRWKDHLKKKTMTKQELNDNLQIQWATVRGAIDKLNITAKDHSVDLGSIISPLIAVRLLIEDMQDVLEVERKADFGIAIPVVEQHLIDKVGSVVSPVSLVQIWFKNMHGDGAPEIGDPDASSSMDAGFTEDAKAGDTLCGMTLVQIGRFISQKR